MVELGHIFEVKSSKRVFQSEWVDRGVPFYRAREIAKLSVDGYVKNELFISEQMYEDYSSKYGKPNAGDIMVTGVGTLGICYLVKDTDKFYFKDGNIIWLKQKSDIDSNYVLWAFKSNLVKEQISRNSSGTTVGTFTITTAKQTLIPLPPLETQNQIAKTLDTASELLAVRKQQLAELDNLIKSTFYDMFGDPVANEKGWKVKTLKEICNKITDGTHHSPNNTDVGEYKYITAKNIKKDGFDLSNLTYITKELHKGIFSRCNPEIGDVLYIKDGVTTGIAQINTLNEEFSMLSSVALLKQNREIINEFYLKEVLNNETTYLNIRRNMGGAAITRLTIKKIQIIQIPVPPLLIQTQFATIVTKIEEQKDLVKKAIDETQYLLDSLMSQYFE
jgi:type I restriction enzyme S subunit